MTLRTITTSGTVLARALRSWVQFAQFVWLHSLLMLTALTP
jgi:hypothetical protein